VRATDGALRLASLRGVGEGILVAAFQSEREEETRD
jgi:hypothetical protein